jgi:hypothetical protein
MKRCNGRVGTSAEAVNDGAKDRRELLLLLEFGVSNFCLGVSCNSIPQMALIGQDGSVGLLIKGRNITL